MKKKIRCDHYFNSLQCDLEMGHGENHTSKVDTGCTCEECIEHFKKMGEYE